MSANRQQPWTMPPCPTWCAYEHQLDEEAPAWDDTATLIHRMQSDGIFTRQAVEHVFAPGLLEHQVDVYSQDLDCTSPDQLREIAAQALAHADWLETMQEAAR